MIKRVYFFRFRKCANDGTGSYSDNSFNLAVRSFFPDRNRALDEATKWAEDQLEEFKGDKVLCMAFNRL